MEGQYIPDYMMNDYVLQESPNRENLLLDENYSENYPYISSPLETIYTKQPVLINYPTINPQLPPLPSRTFMDDTGWTLRNQPLDLRPQNLEWDSRDYNPPNHYLRPESLYSTMSSSSSSSDENTTQLSQNNQPKIEDNLLLTLSTKEFNTKFKCSPKDEIIMLKKKRRTLKNRLYAKNCRKKRDEERQILMIKNAKLRKEVDEAKAELDRIKREIHMLKKELV